MRTKLPQNIRKPSYPLLFRIYQASRYTSELERFEKIKQEELKNVEKVGLEKQEELTVLN
jgi:hypothetical protein